MEGSGKRTITIIVASVIVVVCIVFAIPFNTVTYSVIETYSDTEMKQESYVAKEPYTSRELQNKEETIFDDSPYSVPLGISVPFSVTKSSTRLAVTFRLPAPGGFYIYSSAGGIISETLGQRGELEIPLSKGDYKAVLRERMVWNEKLYLRLRLKWEEMEDVTKYNEVTKYREVPVTVEKQRPAVRYKNVSLWELIFGGGH